MTLLRHLLTPSGGVAPRATRHDSLHSPGRLGLGALVSLLLLGVAAGCGDRVVGWPAEDTTAPTVTATTPVSNATDVAIDTFVSASFSKILESSTISSETFYLARGTTRLPAEVTYVGVTAILVPDAPLAPDTLYTATVTRDVRDPAGNAMESDLVWSFTTGAQIDDVRPQVSFTNPPSGAVSVAPNTAVTATFTETMDPQTVDDTAFTLFAGDNRVEGTVTHVGMVATFRPGERLTEDTVYTARITDAVTDLAGNALAADHIWTFTTGAIDDTSIPEVTSTMPARGAVDVAPNASISATFSEAMDAPTLSTATFTVFDDETQVFGTVSYSGVTATFQPAEALADDTLLTATVTTGARDLAGNALAADFTWTFTTGTGLDTTAPRVTFTNPSNGALDAPFNAPLTATFSEAMQSATLSSATFRLYDGPTLLPASVTYAGVTATLEPAETLQALTTYTARISPSVEDLAGNTMEGEYVWSFRTGTVPDTTPPLITSTSPIAGAVMVPLNTQITATFSEPMAPQTINTTNFILREDNVPVAGAVTWTGVTATFRPAEPLNPSSSYAATMRAGVTDLAGNPMGIDQTWTFDTGTDLDTEAPEVIHTEPEDGDTDVELRTAIVAIFGETMDAATITTSSFFLQHLDTPVAGAVSYNGVTATFQPNDALSPLTVYTATLTTMAADLAGNPLAADHVWAFTTGEAGDTTSPEVTSTMPPRGAVAVAPNTSVSATFTEPMDPIGFSTATFTLSAGGTPIVGSVTYSGVTATFLPGSPLEDETLVTATIAGSVRDIAGNTLGEDYTWTFTSGTAADFTPPRVTFTSPANGALNAPSNAPLTATFSEAMQSSTLSASTFTLFSGPTLLEGAVSYSGLTAVLDPTDPLEAFTTYTARISGDVEDLAGNTMGSEYVWSFTTGLVPDTTPPVITSTSPATGEQMVPLNSKVTATFSETMAPPTINTVSFVLFDGDDQVAGAVTYTGVVAVFTPAEPLDPMTTYTATVRAEVTDLAGNPMGVDRTWTFETGPTPDTQSPRVTFSVPTDDDTGIAVNSSVSAVFSETMDAETITTASFTLQQLDTIIVGTVTYIGRTATFHPADTLDPLTTYSAAIAVTASDLAGNALVQSFVWDFATGIAPDITKPRVSASEPEANETNVPRNTAVTAVFSETMDPSSTGAAHFTLTDDLEVPVEGTVTLIGSTAVFVPDNLLHESTEYTATVTTDATDLAGNALADAHTWSFTTGATLDNAAPLVALVSPDDEATSVPRNIALNATFSESMSPASVHNVSFQLTGPGASLVEGTVRYDSASAMAKFVPEVELLPDTQYTANVASSVKDLSGNRMLLDRSWSFSTGPLSDALLPIQLGTLNAFAVMAETGLTNSNTDGPTLLHGNVGLGTPGNCLGNGSPCTSLNPIINGGLYEDDTAGITTQAGIDLAAAYADAMARPAGTIVNGLDGLILSPGVYTSGSEIAIAVGGTLTLDGQGDANAVWILQAGAGITINNDAQVITINGARAANIFWATAASLTLGSDVHFEGNVLAQESVSAGTGSTILGRLLSRDGAINLATNTITLPPR